MNWRRSSSSVAALAATFLVACATSQPPTYVVAQLGPTSGNIASGTVWFVQDGSQVRIMGSVSGLSSGVHGFHVHEKGDCSSSDATSAGGHLNPSSQPHGPQNGPHHVGDLPALLADSAGVAEVRMSVAGTVIGTGPASFAGKALIVHAGADDYRTQPTGDSGARVACAVIGSVSGRDASGSAVPLPR